MDADLDLLCISVYCTADDLLPERPGNARRRLSDAEIVTLSVAQVLMGIPSDRRFLRAARRQLGHLFPFLPSQDAFHKRRANKTVQQWFQHDPIYNPVVAEPSKWLWWPEVIWSCQP